MRHCVLGCCNSSFRGRLELLTARTHGFMCFVNANGQPQRQEQAMNANAIGIEDLGEDLKLTKTLRRTFGGGTWVRGTLHGHRFEALVFPEHAGNPEYEIDDSRISKLWLQRIADNRVVFNWDRGTDVAADSAVVQAMV